MQCGRLRVRTYRQDAGRQSMCPNPEQPMVRDYVRYRPAIYQHVLAGQAADAKASPKSHETHQTHMNSPRQTKRRLSAFENGRGSSFWTGLFPAIGLSVLPEARRSDCRPALGSRRGCPGSRSQRFTARWKAGPTSLVGLDRAATLPRIRPEVIRRGASRIVIIASGA